MWRNYSLKLNIHSWWKFLENDKIHTKTTTNIALYDETLRAFSPKVRTKSKMAIKISEKCFHFYFVFQGRTILKEKRIQKYTNRKNKAKYSFIKIWLSWKFPLWLSVRSPTRIYEDTGSIPGFSQQVRDLALLWAVVCELGLRSNLCPHGC